MPREEGAETRAWPTVTAGQGCWTPTWRQQKAPPHPGARRGHVALPTAWAQTTGQSLSVVSLPEFVVIPGQHWQTRTEHKAMRLGGPGAHGMAQGTGTAGSAPEATCRKGTWERDGQPRRGRLVPRRRGPGVLVRRGPAGVGEGRPAARGRPTTQRPPGSSGAVRRGGQETPQAPGARTACTGEGRKHCSPSPGASTALGAAPADSHCPNGVPQTLSSTGPLLHAPPQHRDPTAGSQWRRPPGQRSPCSPGLLCRGGSSPSVPGANNANSQRSSPSQEASPGRRRGQHRTWEWVQLYGSQTVHDRKEQPLVKPSLQLDGPALRRGGSCCLRHWHHI